MMMKLTLTAASFSLAMLSFNAAYAGGDHKHHATHGASMEMHDEHASTMGKPGIPAKVTRTVAVDMADNMRFTPENIMVKKGETIKFVVKNSGRIKHEMVLGSARELKEHAAMMKKMPGMEHADANMVVVDPGKTGEIIWQFTHAGKFDFACLQPGHFEAGMRGTLVVTPKSGGAKTSSTSAPTAPMGAATTATAELASAPMPSSTPAAQSVALSEGVVRKIDAANGKITLKHGPLLNLDMPAMTMVFKVKSPDMLKMVKVGDAVKFRVENIKGAFTVTTMEPTAP